MKWAWAAGSKQWDAPWTGTTSYSTAGMVETADGWWLGRAMRRSSRIMVQRCLRRNLDWALPPQRKSIAFFGGGGELLISKNLNLGKIVRPQYLRTFNLLFCSKFQRTLAISKHVLTVTAPPPFYTGPIWTYFFAIWVNSSGSSTICVLLQNYVKVFPNSLKLSELFEVYIAKKKE